MSVSYVIFLSHPCAPCGDNNVLYLSYVSLTKLQCLECKPPGGGALARQQHPHASCLTVVTPVWCVCSAELRGSWVGPSPPGWKSVPRCWLCPTTAGCCSVAATGTAASVWPSWPRASCWDASAATSVIIVLLKCIIIVITVVVVLVVVVLPRSSSISIIHINIGVCMYLYVLWRCCH